MTSKLLPQSAAMWQRAFLFLSFVTWFIGVPAWGQLSTTAAINGSVTDASGAVVAQADVAITDQATNVTTNTQTNTDGTFAAAGLPVGSYKVTVSKTGFASFVASDVVLHPATVATVNALLKLGQVGTQVTVAASAAQVQTSTSEVSNEVSAAQVNTLPLNGRNYQALAAAMPGVTNLSAGSAIGQGGRATNNVMSVNGLGINTTFYALDGMWNENSGNMNQESIVPNPDTIEEVRVLQNNYSPQYSLLGASVVLVQTKSGTSSFHGNAYDYFRNDDLNARNFFSKSVPPLKQNIFGYTLGGPVFIPHVYNTGKQRTFFFWSEQWVISHQGTTQQGATPTQAQRNGTFTTPIYVPGTGNTVTFPQVSPGVYQIPASLLNPSSLAFLNALYPLPNNTANGFNNYLNTAPQLTTQRDDELKIDHNFSDKIRIMGEYLDERQTLQSSSMLSAPAGAGSPFPNNYERDLTRNQMAQIQATTILSPAMVNSFSISANVYVLDLDIEGIDYDNQVPGFNPVLPYNGLISNRLPLVSISQGWSSAGIPAARPLTHASHLDDALADDWSWLHGKHYVQAGINYIRNHTRQNTASATNGQWTFTGQFTGNALADFLLGDGATFTQQSTQIRAYIEGPTISPYIEDRIQLTRRLTVNIGTRMSYMPLPSPQTGIPLFDPALYNRSQAPIVNNDGTITATANYNPINGLIFSGENGVPTNFSSLHNWYWAPSGGFAWDVFGDGKTSFRGGYALAYTRIFNNQDCSFSCPANPPLVQSVNLINQTFPNASGARLSAPTLSTADLNIQASQIQSYSLSVEHQFVQNWTLSVAGAGTRAFHLVQSANYNQPLPDAPYDFNPVINTGSAFTYLYSPYYGYGPINALTSAANANWTALEISLRHPMGANLFVSAAYTWSHGLTNAASTVNAYNLNEYYGNSPQNVPQSFSTTLIWSIPWLKHAQGWRGTAFGGWKYSDITTIRSGFSLTPGLSISRQGIAIRPNVVSGVGESGPKTVAQWFDTGAFTAPAAGYLGDAGTGVITGPGLIDFDMALYKDFRIRENQAIEFRGELFNVFNHPNFTTVSTNYGAGNFGQVTAAADPRIAEFALRYQF